MKHSLCCKLLALLLAVSLLLSLSVPTITAQEGALSANRAVRHTLCTSLSEQAQGYYTESFTYEKLSALCGVLSPEDSQKGIVGNPLYSALQALMSETHTNQRVSYSGYSANSLATYWASTDSADGTDSYLYFYTDIDAADGSYTMNREHVWPKSKASYYQKGGGADLHHLRPSIAGVNSSKSNNTFADLGDSGKAYKVDGEPVIWTGGGKLEVRDNVKGDVARILLYVYCRWGQPNLYSDVGYELLPPFDSDDSANSGERAIESLDTLLEWMLLDPVDEWEMARNDQAENVQGNRNVFIDYPELAWLMFGLPVPGELQTPSGIAAANAHEWSEGVQVEEATCTQCGLVRYTCTDCGATQDALTPTLGHLYSEPVEQQAPTCTADGSQSSICSRCGDTVTEPIPALGHDYVEGVCTRCGAALPIYQLSNELHDGDTVILYAPCAWKAVSSEIINSSYHGAENVRPENDVIYTDSTAIVWTVRQAEDGFQLTTEDGTVLATDEISGLPADGAFRSWNISPAKTENCVYLTSNGEKLLQWNDQYQDFSSAAYQAAAETLFAMQVYKRVYCLHKNTELCNLEATCTSAGYEDALFCSDCGAKLSDGTVLSPLGHSYTREDEAATCEADGCRVYTCARCGDSYSEVIEALGHDLGEWIVTVPSSCEHNGEMKKYCSRCDYYEAEEIPASCASSNYADVPAPGHWAHSGIDFCIEKGIMGSTSTQELLFSPGGTTTRATVVTILYSLTGKPKTEYASVFPDVPEGKWYTPAVLWAYQNGVVTGYDTGLFGPNDLVTREQLAVILKSYTENVLKRSTKARADLSGFADAEKITWSKQAVAWAVASGLISGKPNGNQLCLDPRGTATRAEAAVILMKFCQQ